MFEIPHYGWVEAHYRELHYYTGKCGSSLSKNSELSQMNSHIRNTRNFFDFGDIQKAYRYFKRQTMTLRDNCMPLIEKPLLARHNS
jgi:hypothetical protein